ncbi:S-adenosyl-L-methionine-dependent methyltransferase [Rhodofomes roseus]|uniref:S-adenosyl-L-methionine-dependent methyltransferase n=1 Tax=Rhodofomes roseus TaxID=34475 RepID=A0ABQ8K390_9APHY|nr:S-adenosyl-L-methionine-dependent methyltransferase [Rhodofomes roseus]KAH9831341.1 S-adenosyl-L-methionine-dependent methyltransferase [Rhodofomes roseus]
MSAKAEVQKLLKIVNKATQDALAAYESTGEDVPSLSSTDEKSFFAMASNLDLKRAIRLLEGACEQLCATLAPPGQTIVDLSHPAISSCVRLALRTGIADVLHDHPEGMHIKELASRIKIDEGKLLRIVRTLTVRHCFQEVDVDTFANNRISLALQTSNPLMCYIDLLTTEGYQSGAVLYEHLTDPRSNGSYHPTKTALMYAIKGPENETAGLFEWLHATPDRERVFNTAMTGVGTLSGSLAMLEGLPWDTISTVCDIGSGVGAYSMPLVRRCANLKYTLCDMPATVNQAKEVWTKEFPEAVRSGRVAFTHYNFFEQVAPAGQEIYYMRSIIHDWTDDRALVILKNIRAAMKPTSRLFVQDCLLQPSAHVKEVAALGVDTAPEPMLPNFGAGKKRTFNLDITMLLNVNSKERTLPEITALGRQAGLKFVKVWDLVETSVVEFELDS